MDLNKRSQLYFWGDDGGVDGWVGEGDQLNVFYIWAHFDFHSFSVDTHTWSHFDVSFSVLTLDFRPDGKELAVGTLNAQISFWDPINARQTGSIEGRHDLGYGRKETDKVTGKTLAAGK